MTATSLPAVQLTSSNEGLAADIVTHAFMDDPFYSFAFPDAKQRAHYTRRFWRAMIHTCHLFGMVYTTPALDGVACWTAPDEADLSFWRILRTGFAIPLSIIRFPSEPRRLMYLAISVLDGERRRVMPGAHWYLQVLGVEPSCQGQGVGSRLLAPVLAIADAHGLPCYLETGTERNVAFYERRGFNVLSTPTFPGTPIHLWTMARHPV